MVLFFPVVRESRIFLFISLMLPRGRLGASRERLERVDQASFGMHQVEELLAGLRVVAEDAQHRRRHSLAVYLLDAPHNHAHVSGKIKMSLMLHVSSSNNKIRRCCVSKTTGKTLKCIVVVPPLRLYIEKI